jgi:hypothetical protein
MTLHLFSPQVTRIPVAGPAPYNTLVCVAAETGTGPQTVNPGTTSRWSVTVPTPFRLSGFDQRVPPTFDHSTVAFISATGPAQDSLFQYAVDSVTGAGFNPTDGTYFVSIDVALLPPDAQPRTCEYAPDGSLIVCYWFPAVQVCSFVLVYEPPVAAQPSGTGARSAASSMSSTSRSQLGSLASAVGSVRRVAPSQDDCQCCRKRPCR